MKGQRHALLAPGQRYRNRGGGAFLCLSAQKPYTESFATLINVSSGWQFVAHGIVLYEDGTIEWDFSTCGRFEDVPEGGGTE